MKRKIGIIALIMLVVMSAFAGCGSKDENAESAKAKDGMYYTESKSTPYAGNPIEDVMNQDFEDGVEGEKVIYTAEIAIETENFDESLEALEAKVAEVNGYIQVSRVNGKGQDENDPKYGYYVLRIPKESFNYIKKVSEQWGTIISTSSNSTDVAEEYFDIEARLETLEIQEERLLELLKKASKIEDIINLERELQQVRYQIESHTSSIRKLDSRIEYATISVNVYEVKSEKVVPKSFMEEVIEKIKESSESFGQFLENTLFVLIAAAPYIIIGVIIIALLRKRIGNIHISNPLKGRIRKHKDKE